MLEFIGLEAWICIITVSVMFLVVVLAILFCPIEKQLVKVQIVRIASCRTVWGMSLPPSPPRRLELAMNPYPGVGDDYQRESYRQELINYGRAMQDYNFRQEMEMRLFHETGKPPGYPDHLELSFDTFPGQLFTAELSTKIAVGEYWKVELVCGAQTGKIKSFRLLEQVSAPAQTAS